MQAAGLDMLSAANNIANVNTPEEEIGLTKVNKATAAGYNGVVAQIVPSEAKTVDLASEFTNMTLAKNAYQANAMAFKVASEMSETLIDMMDDDRNVPRRRSA
jgi:flagellar hook protein FlgE